MWNVEHIVLEKMFCGPTIPHMFKFFAERHPECPESKDQPTSEEIFKRGLAEPDSLHRKCIDLFLDIYLEFLGDTSLRTLCYGGLYLVGSLTLSLSDYIL